MYILFDIGGTNTRVALTEDLATIIDVKKFKTPTTFNEGVRLITEAAKALLDGKKVIALAGGMRGTLDGEKTMLVHDAGGDLAKWEEAPLGEKLGKAFKAPVYLENDAAIAGMGEATYGAGEGSEIVVYLTVSTGVGGAKIENGKIDSYRYGFEPGHQVLDVDKTILGEDEEPTLENLVSGSALTRRMGVKPYNIPQEDQIWKQLAEYLADGLRNTILYWSPDVIVLGGSMILGDPKIRIDDIRVAAADILGDVMPLPDIVTADLGDEAGLYGAMALLKQTQG